MTSRATARARAAKSDIPERPGFVTRAGVAVARLIAPPLRAFGVEPEKFVALVELRFELDRRNTRANTGSRFVFALGPLLLLALLLSGSLALILCIIDSAPLAVTVFAGALELMLPMLLIGAWIDVLLDGAAESLLGCRPVDDRTILAARLVFLATYATSTIAILVTLPIVCASIRHGPWPFLPAALIATGTASAFSVLTMLVAFLLLARVVPADRFRIWVMRVQFAIAIVMPLSIQVLPRLGGRMSTKMPEWLAVVFPPAWSGAVATVMSGRATALTVVSSVLAFSVPLTLLALAMWLARGRFAAATLAVQAETRIPARGSTHFLARLMERVCRTEHERAVFQLARVLTMRERTFLVRTLPAMFPMLVPLVSTVAIARRGPELFDYTTSIAMAPLVLSLVQPTFAMLLNRSETPEADWIFSMAPSADARALRFGTRAALLARWCLVPTVVCIVAATALGGIHRGAFALLVSLVALHIDVLAYTVLFSDRPFSRAYTTQNQERAGATGFMMLYVFGTFFVGGVLYVMRDHLPAISITALVLAITAPLCWKTLRN